MMEQRSLPVRVLYTINGSPQYILARFNHKITVLPLLNSPSTSESSSQETTSSNTSGSEKRHPRTRYGTAPLILCLDAICRSSPELLQDGRRDFSVYVLDPLECYPSPAPMSFHGSPSSSSHHGQGQAHNSHRNASTSSQNSRGVAVGMGLIYQALDENQWATPVTGTVVMAGNGMETLEVVFALKETKHHNLHRYIRNQHVHTSAKKYLRALSAADASSQIQWESSPPRRSLISDSLTSDIEPEDQQPRFAKSSELPTIYLGPPKKHRGRKRRPEDEADSLHFGSDAHTHASRSAPGSRAPSQPPGKPGPKKTAAPRPPPFVRGPLIRESSVLDDSSNEDSPLDYYTPDRFNLVSSSHPTPAPTPVPPPQIAPIPKDNPLLALIQQQPSQETNTALLSILSAIDSSASAPYSSSSSSEGNAALIKALSALLSVLPPSDMTAASQGGSSTTVNAVHTSNVQGASGDEDVVLLDKENVNPTEFKRRSSLSTKDQPPLVNSSPARGLGRTNSENVTVSSPPRAPEQGRKRTLSDFMEEREKERQADKDRKKERTKSNNPKAAKRSKEQHQNGDDGHSEGTTVPSGSAPTPTVDPAPATSWLRPYSSLPIASSSRQTDKQLSRSVSDPEGSNGSVEGANTVSSSSLLQAQGPTPAEPVNRKRFVLPEWAKTNTATKPRIVRNNDEENDAVPASSPTRGRKSKGKGKNAKGGRNAKSSPARPTETEDQNTNEPSASQTQSNSEGLKQPAPRPAMASGSWNFEPPIVAASNFPIFSSSSPLPPSSPLPSSPPSPPRTPSPSARRMRSPSSFPEVPQTPPQHPDEEPSLFTPSPKKPAPGSRSSLRASARAERFGDISRMPPVPSVMAEMGLKDRHQAHHEAGLPSQEANNDKDDSFEVDVGPSSPSNLLPTLSSDFDLQPGSQYWEQDQHWSVGLPPSSPPPPSSPLLTPSDGSEWLSTTSVSELHTPEIEASDDQTGTTNAVRIDKGKGKATEADLTFPTNLNAPEIGVLSSDSLDSMINFGAFDFLNDSVPDSIFSSDEPLDPSFYQLNSSSSASISTAPALGGGIEFSRDIADYDFSEFWESVKPLVENGSVGGADAGMNFFAQGDMPTTIDPRETTTDHTKLAEDLQSLFGGCLV